MNTEICNTYRELCLKNKKSIDELILFRLYHASVYDVLDLRNTGITDTDCLLISETLKLVPTVKIWNLSDCLLTSDSLDIILNAVCKLNNLSELNLNGNQIGYHLTAYTNRILFNNFSITELWLDFNDIGNTIDTFANLCDCLILNTVLNILHLANNKLCHLCGFYLAEMLNVNKCLKHIDLSWNCIGDIGATLLLKSLKTNEILEVLNIQGNSVSVEISTLIDKKLKHNKSNKKDDQNKNMSVIKYGPSVNKNDQTQLNSFNYQYRNIIDELRSKLHFLQIENKELKKNLFEEKESKINILKHVKNMESELSLKKQNLSAVIKKISFEVSKSDVENMNSLEDLEKIVYILKQIKNNFNNKIIIETKKNQTLLETLPKLDNELNAIKVEFKSIKSLLDIEIKNYVDNLTAILDLLLKIHHGISNKTICDTYMKNYIDQHEIYISDEQTKALVFLNMQIKTLLKEKKDLELRLAKVEKQSREYTQTIQELEDDLVLTKNELQEAYKKHLLEKAIQNSIIKASADDIPKINLTEKDQNLQLNKTIDHKINTNLINGLSKLKEKLQLEKQKFIEKKKEDEKLTEELYLMFSQCVNKMKKDNSEDTNK